MILRSVFLREMTYDIVHAILFIQSSFIHADISFNR